MIESDWLICGSVLADDLYVCSMYEYALWIGGEGGQISGSELPHLKDRNDDMLETGIR